MVAAGSVGFVWHDGESGASKQIASYAIRHIRATRCFDVDIEVLIERLGPNRETIDAMKRVTCGHCGRRAETWRGHGGMPITQHMKKPDA